MASKRAAQNLETQLCLRWRRSAVRADVVAWDRMSAVNWVPLSKEAVSVGDYVSTDAGGMPIYRVVKLANGQAWVQGERRPAVEVMPLERFHWRAPDPGQG